MHICKKKCTFANFFSYISKQRLSPMKITFKATKSNIIYQRFVEDPTDRAKQRAFYREFDSKIASSAAKLHQRLLAYSSVATYNKDYGQTTNRIETTKGTRDKDPLLLKVRVTGAWRKFFYSINTSSGDFLLEKEWSGQFDAVTDIYITNVNNHDYDAVH